MRDQIEEAELAAILNVLTDFNDHLFLDDDRHARRQFGLMVQHECMLALSFSCGIDLLDELQPDFLRSASMDARNNGKWPPDCWRSSSENSMLRSGAEA